MGDTTEPFDETHVWVQADYTQLAEILGRMTGRITEPPEPLTAYPNLVAIPREIAHDWGLPAVPPPPRPIDVALDILRPHLAWQPLYRPTT